MIPPISSKAECLSIYCCVVLMVDYWLSAYNNELWLFVAPVALTFHIFLYF